jgi:hypothetical protein
MYHRLRNHFGHPMELLGDVGHVESHFFLFGDSVNVGARLCIVCAKRIIGSEIVLDAPDGTPRWRGQAKTRFCLFGVLILTQDRCTICVEHTIGSDIIFDAPDGNPSDVDHVESHFFMFGHSVSVSARWVHGLG